MQVARLQHGRQSLRIGHRGEVAIVCGADPTRARRVGTKFARRVTASHRFHRTLRETALKGLAFARKAFAIEGGIVRGARASAVGGNAGWCASTKVMRSVEGSLQLLPSSQRASALIPG